MTGETILRAIRVDKEKFPKFALTEIKLYDGKNRIEERETVTFAESLFANNAKSEALFLKFIKAFEEHPTERLTVTITETHVIVHTKPVSIFSRYPSQLDELLWD